MFRRWLNHATVRVAISPRGPILIKSGQETADPTRPGMEFVRTRHAAHGETVYLPGTSLKGAMRSHAERVLRGLGIDACDPFDDRSNCRRGPRQERPQGQRGGRRPPPPASHVIFSVQCPACRTFGSLKVGGRCNVEDAYPWARNGGSGLGHAAAAAGAGDPGASPPSGDQDDGVAANATETRWQVGIDRRTGQAQGAALFDLEVVVAGRLHTAIHLDNFQLWQLGLIGALLEDMDQGDLPIGFGKTRGLGQVGVEIEGIEVESLGRDGRVLRGAAALCSKKEAADYGLEPDDAMALPPGIEPAATWRGRRIAVAGKPARNLLGLVTEGPLQRWVEARTNPGARR